MNLKSSNKSIGGGLQGLQSQDGRQHLHRHDLSLSSQPLPNDAFKNSFGEWDRRLSKKNPLIYWASYHSSQEKNVCEDDYISPLNATKIHCCRGSLFNEQQPLLQCFP